MATIALLHFDRLFPPQHGGARYLRRLAEILARQGHCCVVVMLAAMDGFADHRQNVTELPTAITNLTRTPRGDISFSYRGVTYRATLREDSELKPFLWRTLREKTFDIALVGDEHTALSVLALNILRELAYCRVVYCVHTMYNLPFGERPVGARTRLTDALAGIDAYLTTSSFGVRTLRSFTDTPVRLLYPDPSRPVSTSQPPAAITRPIGIVNPCLGKGIDLFISITERLPCRRFIAVPGWGTTPRDMTRLQALTNVSILPWREDVTELFDMISLLLVPSVWEETYGMIAVEAAAAGLPVIGSDRGGLPEALLGASHPIPVEPLKPEAINGVSSLPFYDTKPWIAAIEDVLGDTNRYVTHSISTRNAAQLFWQECSWDRIDVFARISGFIEARTEMRGDSPGT